MRDTLLGMLLSSPFVVSTTEPRNHYFYRHLLAALSMVDGSFRLGHVHPDPMLCLDDLILRCIALLLHPTLTELDARAEGSGEELKLRRTVHELMGWMRSNLDRPISLSEVERKSQYGRRSIQKGFKAELGCGPMQWLRRQRLDLARQRLEADEPGLTVTQVAQACGYINLASFSRDFRERFGIGAREVLVESRRRHANG
jgi:AraC-like DNA-binding protein